MTNPAETLRAKGKIALLYTDGGARPVNPGYAGSGVHGYVFTDPVEKPVIISNHFLTFIQPSDNNSVPKATMTTTGYQSCDKDGRIKDQAKYVKPDFFIDIVNSYADLKTNNYAELYAILLAFKAAKEIEGLERLTILADSQYALDAVFVDGDYWRDHNWTTKGGNEAKNIDVVSELLTLRDDLRNAGVKVGWTKVKGHGDDVGNSHADYLATIGCTRSRHGKVMLDGRISTNKKYWEPEVDRHAMLQGRRFIYPRQVSRLDPKNVFMIDPGGTDLTIGKRDHEGFSVVQLNTPCTSYQALLNSQNRYGQDTNWPMNLRSDRLYNKFVQKFIQVYGEDALIPNRQGIGLYFLDGGVVASEHNPPALIYRTDEAFANLLERLEEYKTLTGEFDVIDFPEDWHGISGIDITKDFFETIEKKKGKEVIEVKQLRKEIEVGYLQHPVTISVTVEGKTFERTIPLTLGMDLPLRNSLKRLETEDPIVTLITWRTAPGSFQYACVVESHSGIGIWSNYHCARFFS